MNGIFQHRKATGKKERKTKSIVRNSHNHRFSRRGTIGIESSALLYPSSPSLPIKHLTMLHELFLVLGGPISYASCLAKNGGRGLKTCAVSAGNAVILCGSVSDICAKVFT